MAIKQVQKVELLDEILCVEELNNLIYFGAYCLPAVLRDENGKKFSNYRQAMAIWGEKLTAKLTNGKFLGGTVKQHDVRTLTPGGRLIEVESKVRTKRKNAQIDPFRQDEIIKVLNGEVEKVIFTYLVDSVTGVLLEVYADDAKKLFEPANNLLFNKNRPNKQQIRLNEKFFEISTCILNQEIVKKAQYNK